jgi:hypothetical protein
MHLTNVLSSQSITLPNTIPQKLEVIAFMLVSSSQEAGGGGQGGGSTGLLGNH